MTSTRLALLAVLCASVCACGGGGDDAAPVDNATLVPAESPAPAPSPSAPAPAPAPAPTPAPAPAPNPLVEGAEPLPSLVSPQAGSLAAVGNGIEGTYFDWNGQTAFIDADNTLIAKQSIYFVHGKLNVTGLNWETDASTERLFVSKDSYHASGTFVPYARLSSSGGDFSGFRYAAGNALAVAMVDLQGTWSIDAMRIVVAADGTFTGSTGGSSSAWALGSCTLSGSFTRDDPASLKNLFKVELNASPNGNCKLQTSGTYRGYASIGFKGAGLFDANGYFRVLGGALRNGDGFMTWGLDKERPSASAAVQ